MVGDGMTAEDAAREVIAVALAISPDRVGLFDTVDTLAEWTSIAHVRLVLEIESRFNCTISPEAIISLRSVESILTLLKSGQIFHATSAEAATRDAPTPA